MTIPPIVPVRVSPPVCWPLSPVAETGTSDRASAACYCGPEDVGIFAIVVPELHDTNRRVLGMDFAFGEQLREAKAALRRLSIRPRPA
jgi:hypothetical protein